VTRLIPVARVAPAMAMGGDGESCVGQECASAGQLIGRIGVWEVKAKRRVSRTSCLVQPVFIGIGAATCIG
jgi:hypothetical protein